jgi:hypothetical protein
MEKSGSELALESTHGKNSRIFESLKLLKMSLCDESSKKNPDNFKILFLFYFLREKSRRTEINF